VTIRTASSFTISSSQPLFGPPLRMTGTIVIVTSSPVVGAGGEIVTRHRLSTKGRSRGLELERVPDVAILWELRDGKIFKTTLYQHPSEALEAAGLRE
jgi:hypothetical protein